MAQIIMHIKYKNRDYAKNVYFLTFYYTLG